MDKIQNKTALITGAAAGLGYKYSEDLLKNGAKSIAILDLPSSKGAESAATLEKKFGKGRAIFLPCDVSNAVQFEEAVIKVISIFNTIDIFINNAGILDDVRWEKMVNINVVGVIRGSYLALDHMSKHNGGKGGTIVNIASIAGISSDFKPFPVYSATKSAVVGFSNLIKSLEDRTDVRVMVLCPGVTITNLISGVENKYVKYVDTKYLDENKIEYSGQSVGYVSQSMMDLIQNGKNGAIWVSENEKPPYQINVPHYREISVPI